MRMWSTVGVGVGLLGVLVVGCTSPLLPNADVQTFCTSKATQECQVSMLCGEATTTNCINARQAVCISDAETATSSGTRAYSQPNAAACIDAVKEAYAEPTVPFATLQDIETVCEEVFPGTVEDGNTCKTDFDCANMEVCSGQAGSKEMICAPAVMVDAGKFCANPGSVCPTGYYCTGTPAKCEPGGTAAGAGTTGSGCKMDSDCSPTAPYCDLSVKPKKGSDTGSCELGQSFATGADDCNAFGATN